MTLKKYFKENFAYKIKLYAKPYIRSLRMKGCQLIADGHVSVALLLL